MAKIPDGVRKAVHRRDGWVCRYCGVVCARLLGPRLRTIDHIIPSSRGGPSTLENCVVACSDCNVGKGNQMLEDTDMTLRPPPKDPDWRLDYAVIMNDHPPAQRPDRPPPVPGARWCEEHGCWHWPTTPLPPLNPADLF